LFSFSYGEVAAAVEPKIPLTVTKVESPKVIEVQYALVGRVRVVQVMPSGEVAATVEPNVTVTKVESPKVIEVQSKALGIVR
jgi:hypothetical protein